MRSGAACSILSLVLFGCTTKPTQQPVTPGTVDKVATVKALLSLSGADARHGIQSRLASEQSWRDLTVGQGLAKGAWLRTGAGGRGKLELSDGSVLLLNRETQLRLQEPRRLEVEQGELLAQVQPAAGEQPLSIETPSARVRVTGTKLNLLVAREQTVVDVTRGTVEVEAAGAKVQAGAGERVVVKSGGRPRIAAGADLARVTSWSREIGEPARAIEHLEDGFGSLTARAPGQGGERPLRLDEQTVRVTIRDNISRTEVEQVYHNPSGQTLEGTYRFPLPAGASIARLALYVGNRLMEGEVVERQRARRIFDKIVNDTIQPRDPALLEWMGGRIFRMKIFPIPPRSSRRVILAYVQPLTASYGRYRYVYPMATSKSTATRVGRFALEMKVSSTAGVAEVEAPLYPVLEEREDEAVKLRYEASDFRPAASFVANYQPAGQVPEMQVAFYEKGPGAEAGPGCRPGDGSNAGDEGPVVRVSTRFRAPPAAGSGRKRWVGEKLWATTSVAPACADRGGFFMAVLRPELPLRGQARQQDYLFLLDSSLSTGKEGWAAQLGALEAFLSEVDLRSRINVMACDERCRVLGESFRQPSSELRKQALAFGGGIEPGGSSNLQAAFAEAARLAGSAGGSVHVIYMGDGRPSAGELREPQLARLTVEALRQAGASLSVLQLGDDVGELFLTEATRKLAGAVYRLEPGDDLRARAFEIVAAHYRPTLTDLRVSFEGLGVHHVYPETLPSLVAGAEVVLTGRYDGPGSGAVLLAGTVDGTPFERRFPLTISATAEERSANSFIPRLWAKDHLDALSLSDYTKNRPEIVRVSQRYGVLSRATAFLVLENEQMYRELKVKRRRDRDDWTGEKVAARPLQDSTPPPWDEQKQGKEEERRSLAESEQDPSLELASAHGPGPTPASTPAFAPAAGAMKPRGARAAPAAPAMASGRARVASRRQGGELANPWGRGDDQRGPAARSRPDRDRMMANPDSSDDDGSGGGGAGGLETRGSWLPSRAPLRVAKILPVPGAIDSGAAGAEGAAGAVAAGGAARASEAAARREEALERRVASAPLQRGLRQSYHRALVQNGRYEQALRHASQWAELDGSDPGAILALGETRAALGQLQAAIRSYSASVEIQPWNKRLHRELAQMYRNKGELERSCAHTWSIMSIEPGRLEHHLELARCLVQLPDGLPVAMRLLAELASSAEGKAQGRAGAARIGRALAELSAGAKERGLAARDIAARGHLVLKATWDNPVDLDLALVTPDGSRVTPLHAGRHGLANDSRDGRTAELLSLRRMVRDGTYRVEIGPASVDALAGGSARGTLLVTAHGRSRAIPFVVSGPATPVARIEQTTR